VDLTDPVLNVANYNIRSHNVADRVTLCQGDLLEPVPEPVDLVVANLPYIPTERVDTLQPEVRWEPRAALDGGADGLDLVRRLLEQATTRLKDQGVILLELDPEQMPVAREIAQRHFPDANITVEQDLARQDRIFVLTRGLEE
jgi:release factor glutamine methyltransferase